MKLLVFPDTRQATTWTCGAGAVQAILHYYGIERREDELAEELHATEEDGVFVGDILKCFRRYGLRTTVGSTTLEQVKEWLDHEIPVILAVQAWSHVPCDYTKVWDEGHYVVAVGYDEDRGRVILEDPSVLGTRGYMTYDELDARWHDIDRGGKKLEHFGIAIWGKPPTYDPNVLVHVAAERLAKRWAAEHSVERNRGYSSMKCDTAHRNADRT